MGCESKRASLEKRYAEARLLFQQGYTDQPLPLAEAGFKESASYPDLNWKFRILTAEARNRKDLFDAALEILEPEPPSNIPSEIFWRRRITQALSLCQLGKYPQSRRALRAGRGIACGTWRLELCSWSLCDEPGMN